MAICPQLTRKARILLVFLLISLFIEPPAFTADPNYHQYNETEGEMTLTGRIYHVADGAVVVEAWPRPRKLNLKVDGMTLRSPSGTLYRSSELDNFPMRQLPQRRSRYRQTLTSWFRGLFGSYAYATCGHCGSGEGGSGTEGKKEGEDQRSAEAAAGFGLLVGLAAESEKEWVTAGQFSVKEEPGDWTAMIDVADGKGKLHRFTVPFKLSDLVTTPPPPEPQRAQDVAQVSWTDEETGLTTTVRLNPDGSRTKTVVDGSGKVVSKETRPPPPKDGATKTYLDPETGLRIAEKQNPDGSVTRRAEDDKGNWSEGHYYPGGKKEEPPLTPEKEEPPLTPEKEEPPLTPEKEEPPPTEEEGLPLPEGLTRPPPEEPSHPTTQERPHEPPTTGIGGPLVAIAVSGGTVSPPPEEIPVRLGIDITKCTYPWKPEKDNITTFTAKIYIWVPGQGWVFPGPPRVITFQLSGVSKEKGICLNKGDETTPDLYFKDPIPGFTLSGGEGTFYDTARTTEAVVSATVTVTSDDYGSFGWIKSSAPGCEDIEPNGPVSIPLDDNLNTIADCASQDDNGASPRKDDDRNPTLDGHPGDGYSNYEEYRGFFVQDSHTRTLISRKDLLVNDQTNRGVGLYPVCGVECNLVKDNELKDRVGNFNAGHATTGPQCGLIVKLDTAGELDVGVGGKSFRADESRMGPPRNALRTVLRRWSAYVVAHEMGHSTCSWHHGDISWDKTWVYAPEDNAFYNNRVSSAIRRQWREWWGDPPLALTCCGLALPAEIMLHTKGKQQSGDVTCIMKYVGLFDHYSDGDLFQCWPAGDTFGTIFCSTKSGTGFNAGGQVGGDPDKGDCLGQMRVNDK